jgi:hypothetical protein
MPLPRHGGRTMRKALWSCVTACSLLAGCAAMHPQPERVLTHASCHAGSACPVDVKVTCDRFYGCSISVDPDLVVVEDRGRRTDIVWRLSGETGARFASNGIAFNDSLFMCEPRGDGREFVCGDTPPEFGVFEYRITVTVPQSLFGPRGVQSLDPWIVNR